MDEKLGASPQTNSQEQLSSPDLPVPKQHKTGLKMGIVFGALGAVLILVLVIILWFWQPKKTLPLPAAQTKQTSQLSQTVQPAQSTQTDQEKLTVESSALLGVAKLKFPTVNQIVNATSVPVDIQDFILSGASQIQYGVMDYAGSQTGFYARYTIASSTLQDALVKTFHLGVKDLWVQADGESSSLFAFVEYSKNDNSSQARISVILKGEDIQVTVQTITLKR